MTRIWMSGQFARRTCRQQHSRIADRRSTRDCPRALQHRKENQFMIGTLRRTSRDERGFTLLQLLVVVTVLGILAAIVTSSLIVFAPPRKTHGWPGGLRPVRRA